MTVTSFINLCQHAPIVAYDKSLRKTKQENTESGVVRFHTFDPMIENLKEAIIPRDREATINRTEIERWKIGLVNHWIIEQNDHAKHAYDLLCTLTGILGHEFKQFRSLDHTEWERAISLLKGYMVVDPSLVHADEAVPNKYRERAKAVKRLQDMGYAVTLNELEVNIDLARAYHDLDERINRFGGVAFIERLFNQIEFSKEFGQFILPKSSSASIPLELTVYDLPCNFIFNLALKSTCSAGIPRYKNEGYFKRTLDLFSLLCYASYEVQTFSIWENIFHQDKDKLSYIRDLIFRESIFGLHQSSVRFICRLIRFIAKKERISFGKNSNDLLIVIYHLLSSAKPERFQSLNLELIKKTNKYVTPDINHILNQISIPVSELNKGFLSPLDYDKVNFWNFPLIKMDDGSYLMQPATILSRCCLEAYLAHLRNKIKDFDGWLGTVIEEFIYDLFNRNGIEVDTGEYSFKIDLDGKEEKINGECDGLIELDKEIVLLEIKKKSLVRSSRSGDDAQILTDLGATLLASQIQGFKTQLALCVGTLNLNENSNTKTIVQNGRNICRWSIALIPFGDLQDKSIVGEILNIFTYTDFGYSMGDETKLTDSQKEEHRKKKKQIEKVCKLQNELRKYIGLLELERPFMTSSFFDVEKIFYILKVSPSIKKFSNVISKLRHISFGTLDFYRELSLLTKEK